MSKKYKGKTCVYCAKAGTSETGDHVVARSFFLEEARRHLIIVPACTRCNKDKSDLEHYLATVLPFGAQHGHAGRTLQEMVPGRLEKNQKLLRSLRGALKPRWTSVDGGPFQQEGALPLDGPKLTELFVYIVRGLAFHHWELILDDGDFFVTASYIIEKARHDFAKMMALEGQGVKRVAGNLGDGVFVYEGTQLTTHPGITLWRMSLCGAEVNGGPDSPNERIKEAHGVTVYKSSQVAELFMKAMARPEKYRAE